MIERKIGDKVKIVLEKAQLENWVFIISFLRVILSIKPALILRPQEKALFLLEHRSLKTAYVS